jgi:3',5'-cyclic AMP phosphodiesterase CpdA
MTGATQSRTTPSATTDRIGSTYTFAVCGDNRIVGIDSGIMGRIIDSAKSRGAAFIVDTGDVTTSGSREELAKYHDYTASTGIGFYTVPGNHDVGRGGTSEAYEEIIGPPYYSFDYAGDHFVIVDNADDNTGIPDTQMQWFTQDLADNAGRPKQFIFAHIPVGSTSLPSGHVTGEGGDAGLRSGQMMVSEAVKYANVKDIFFGHIHTYLAYRLDGIDAYVTGGAGAPLLIPEGMGGYYHYLLVTVREEEVEVEVIQV